MNTQNSGLISTVETSLAQLARVREKFSPDLGIREFGRVKTISAGVATVSGLPTVGYQELVEFPDNLYGLAFNLDEEEVGLVLLGACNHVSAGAEVRPTGRVMDVPVGHGTVGRVIDPLGRALDDKGPVVFSRLPRWSGVLRGSWTERQ